MNYAEFKKLVKQLRLAQRKYFRDRFMVPDKVPELLKAMRPLERQIDKLLRLHVNLGDE